ncbi:MAG: AraC family transcriptional regulator ligand-binding domain-containing protein [Anderseniella sp.]
MDNRRGFTRASALGPIADFVERRGGNINRVFERVDMPVGILETPDLAVPLQEQFRVLRSAGREIADPFLGARLGRLVRIENLSAFGRWVSRAHTLLDAIDRSNRGLNLYLQTGTTLTLTQQHGVARWFIEFHDRGYEGRFQNELLGVSYLIDVVRCFAGRGWTPDLIRVTGTGSNQAAALENIFAAPVLAGNRVSSIEFDASLLNVGNASCRTGTFVTNRNEPASEKIPPEHDEFEAITALVSVAMLDGYPKIDWIASKMGVTRRTLQRKISDHGTTFSRLLADQLRSRATTLLAGEDKSITQVAFQLGYADAAHFSRAFSRWTGMSPREYQRQLWPFNTTSPCD